MLAVVQAIAQQTLRRAKDPTEFAASFGGRIQVMSRMHSLLSESGWQGANLHDVVHDQILAAHETSRIAVSGPPAKLAPQISLHVALMLHELGTNSVKYGEACASRLWDHIPARAQSVTMRMASGEYSRCRQTR